MTDESFKQACLKNIKITIPDSLHQPPKIFADIDCSPYRINRHRKMQSKNIAAAQLIYAPAPLSYFFLAENQVPHSHAIICDKTIKHHRAYIIGLRLLIKNEQRRMGSDVPSPLMTKALRQYVSIADYFYFTIGDWLALTLDIYKKIQHQNKPIFWLDKNTSQDDLMLFCKKHSII